MRKSCLALSVAILSLPVQAEVDQTLVVTANRVALTLDDTLASVTVIKREDIERQQARTLPELLRGMAGLTVTQSGGVGATSSVFVRGTNSSHVLVLVDGVKVGSATLGTVAWESLPLETVERIEIVRGPRASLYGSEAIGGVIQIFTRKGKGAPAPSFSVTAGSDHFWSADTSVSGTQGDWDYALGVSAKGTEGFNACNPDSGTLFVACYDNEPDDDGYREQAWRLNAGKALANGGEIRLSGFQSQGEVDYDGAYQNSSEPVQKVLGLTTRLPVSDDRMVELRYGYNNDLVDSFNDGVFVSRFETRRNTVGAQVLQSLDSGTLIVGAEYQRDEVLGTTSYAKTSRDNKALFGQWLTEQGADRYEASVRHDRNEQFGEKTTGSLAWGHQLFPGVKSFVSYGSAFKAPTFNDLYFPGYGSPTLTPETSWSLEAGLKGSDARIDWSATLYHTRIRDLIAADPSNGWLAANLGQARISGVELTASGTVSPGFWWRGTITLQDPESQDAATKGNTLPNRERTKLTVSLDRQIEHLTLGADWMAVGRRYGDLYNTQELDGYGRLDLRARYNLSHGFSVAAKIENVTDQTYETVYYYNQPGRSFYLTLNWQP
ncbi:TonB-dependent receptor [Hahella sp. SMD15-11]|uniref:TonB-dependent receptor n=1 Tax=Thermohahella caldifontis TaxID=3142973 RepID=A0AB39UX22_9GAMM